MLNPISPWICLAFEAAHVIELRLVRLAWGGPAAWEEAHLMVEEKFIAAAEAAGTLMFGGSPGCVIARYRMLVASNEARLTAV